MTRSLYVTAVEAGTGKTVVALGLLDLLARSVRHPVVFRPLVGSREAPDPLVELLRERYGLQVADADAVGLTWAEAAALVEATPAGPDTRRLVADLVGRVDRLRATSDFVLVVGTDFTGPSPATELDLNAVLAVNLGAPVVTVLSAAGKDVDTVAAAAREARSVLAGRGCVGIATVVNRVDAACGEPDAVAARVRADAGPGGELVYALPELPVLSALTVDEVVTALDGTVLSGSGPRLEREADGYLVGSGHLQTVLPLLREGALLVTSGDRLDLAVGAAAAAVSPHLPTPAGVVLTLGTRPEELGLRLLAPSGIPVVSVPHSTYATIHRLEGLQGVIRPGSARKVAAALGAFSAGVDAAALAERIRLTRTEAVTPAMFNARLLARARSDRRTIVLPESEDERVLRAVEELVHLDVADLVLLGDPGQVRARAGQLGVDLGAVTILDPVTSELRSSLAEHYAQLRAHKGVTLESATETLADPTYFATLMVATGRASGMVSGATHTTALTIRPALEVIKTSPGVSRVSGAFLMCLPDRVLVFADCAVNLDPTAEELAEIALSTAETALAFGVTPRVAMVSYSTGTSGAGVDVEKVRTATALVAQRRPDLPLAGPIQYDAAVDPAVGAAKLPGNPVAGHATVLVFPDLNTGNTTYKAVQRSGEVVAVGPVLQGLRRPVNDLSRGCTVADIVSTVAITAVQAQQQDAERAQQEWLVTVPGDRVLVVNAGSSSLKYQLREHGAVAARGLVEQIGSPQVPDHAAALTRVLAELGPDRLRGLAGVGHRVVHGGSRFTRAVVVDDAVEAGIGELSSLAPLHNPAQLAGIRALRAVVPDVPQVAVFDTAFHATIPPRASTYALPRDLAARHGVRKYGFHGTSHRCVTRRAARHLGLAPADTHLVTAHIGNGVSVTAVRGGASIDTSMGMSPLQGAVMGTRSGDLDPAVVFHLVREAGMSADDVDVLLNSRSGLLGLAGASDVRAVQRAADGGDAAARLALEVYAYRLTTYVAAYLGVVGGAAAVVFTAGVGENSPAVRAAVCAPLAHLGLRLDEAANAAAVGPAEPVVIDDGTGDVRVLVVPTDEEGEIAAQVLALVHPDGPGA